MFKSFLIVGIGALLLALSSCENQPTEVQDYTPQPVLQAFLYRGEPLTQVAFQRVAPLQGVYNPADYGIADAQIIIYPLNVPSPDTLHLVQHSDPDSANLYVPAPGESLIPQGKMRYRIEAGKPSENLFIWAETLVPDTFSFTVIPVPMALQPDTLDTLSRYDDPLYLNWTLPDSGGGFVLSVTCQTPFDSLIPLDPDFEIGVDSLKAEDVDLTSLWSMRYDQQDMLVPWFMFTFQGWHQVYLESVAVEFYDYMLTMFRLQQGIPVQLEGNINGGLGIFAGLSKHAFWVYVKRVE
jgi:hypothetical protein